MADLKTDYKDDILDTSQNLNRTFSIVDNTTGTVIYPNVSLEETTVFTQEGDSHSANITNEQNRKINQINADLTDMTKSTFGTPVSLTTNEYIAPSDGYLHVSVQTNSYIHVLVNGVFKHQANGSANSSANSGLYIRKGMTLQIVVSSGTASAEFIPFD